MPCKYHIVIVRKSANMQSGVMQVQGQDLLEMKCSIVCKDKTIFKTVLSFTIVTVLYYKWLSHPITLVSYTEFIFDLTVPCVIQASKIS